METMSERNARRITRKASQNHRLTARDVQEDLADSGVVVHCSTVQHKYGLHGRDIRRKLLLRPNHKIQRLDFAKEHLDKPDAFWKQVLSTDEVKIRLSYNSGLWSFFYNKKGKTISELPKYKPICLGPGLPKLSPSKVSIVQYIS